MSAQKRAIALHKKRHRMRYRCPNGHSSWEATNGHWWCQSCARRWDVDPAFTELRDAKTDETLAREEVVLYDDDTTEDGAELYKGRG